MLVLFSVMKTFRKTDFVTQTPKLKMEIYVILVYSKIMLFTEEPYILSWARHLHFSNLILAEEYTNHNI